MMVFGESVSRPTDARSETRLGAANGSTNGERLRVVALCAAIVVVIAVYLVLRSVLTEGGSLLPFQMLARDLVQADQEMFATLKARIGDLEAVRATTGRWPEPAGVPGLPRLPPGAEALGGAYTWALRAQGLVVNYLARPAQSDSSAAWLVVYREPDPSAPADTARDDEEHHRLPDGTVLHVSLWTRRFGRQVSADFFPQPEGAGWTQVLTAPLDRRAPSVSATRAP